MSILIDYLRNSNDEYKTFDDKTLRELVKPSHFGSHINMYYEYDETIKSIGLQDLIYTDIYPNIKDIKRRSFKAISSLRLSNPCSYLMAYERVFHPMYMGTINSYYDLYNRLEDLLRRTIHYDNGSMSKIGLEALL